MGGVFNFELKCAFIVFITARLKVHKIRVALGKTGNKVPIPVLSAKDDAILRILGETPSFRGVQSADHETPIEANVSSQDVNPIGMETSMAQPIGEVSEVTKAINSGKLQSFSVKYF